MRYTLHPVLLTVPLNLRLEGGPRFSTDYREDDIGGPNTHLESPQASWYWTLTFKRNSRDFGELTGFFLARKGSGYGWLFDDPYDRTDSDNGGTGLVKTLEDGKRYLVKQYKDSYSPHYRRIKCPVPSTVVFSGVGGSPQVNTHTGEVTGATSDGLASFQFRTPVIFTTDVLDIARNAGNGAGEWSNVELWELGDIEVAT